jgi:hypothetical protein
MHAQTVRLFLQINVADDAYLTSRALLVHDSVPCDGLLPDPVVLHTIGVP